MVALIPRKTAIHLLLVSALAALIGIGFLQEPVLGDDLTYWSFAANLHEQGLSAWQRDSFYDLRWPVWGVCWVLQTIFNSGLSSYWGGPVFYLAAGAGLAFLFGKRLTSNSAAAWCCGLAFAFHPFLDSVAYSPMPDLAEAVWSGAAMLAWWNLMHVSNARRALLFAVATGACVTVIEANRVTGVFIVPVLILCTALFFRRRFHWLIAAGFIALALYAAECAFYHHLFGDWLHDLSANALNKEARGTEFPNPWLLPFRFLDTFWHEPLARVYSLAALVGIWFAWRKRDTLGRVIVLWFVLLLLEYSCTPQSLSPIRPLVRDGARFLSSVALPMSLLAAPGIWELVSRVPSALVSRLSGQRVAPVLLVIALLLSLIAATQREFFNPGFVPPFRHYIATVPDGASIFTHSSMRDLVRLVDANSARRLRWIVADDILQRAPQLEAAAAGCDEFWYVRKLAWLRSRQELQRKKKPWQPVLASYFETPERDWKLTESILKNDTPDLVFYRKRNGAAAAQSFQSNAPEWRDILPPLPSIWENGHNADRGKLNWKIPAQFKGRLVRLELDAASSAMDAFSVRLRFVSGNRKQKKPIILRPFLFPIATTDFFALRIPADSASCEIQLRYFDRAKRVEFRGLRAVTEVTP